LLIYCGLYLASVVVAGGLKYLINVLQTLIGQQATADMRQKLYAHILQLPLFLLKTGKIVESGSYAELMQQEGAFYQLVMGGV
jgi:ABC-type multidrug transport system fused ATPase/permease subunit